MKKFIFAILIITLTLTILGCKKNGDEITIEENSNLKYKLISSMDETLVATNENIYIIKNETESKSTLSRLSATNEISNYDSNYFEKNDLMIISLFTNPEFKLSLQNIEIENDGYLININRVMPNLHHDLGVYKSFLVTVPKGSIKNEFSINVKYNDIYIETNKTK